MTITGSGDAHQRAYDERIRAERDRSAPAAKVTVDIPDPAPTPTPAPTRPTSRKKPGTTSTT